MWRPLYERFTNYHMLDNLIWVWNAQDPDLIVRDNAYWLWFAVWNWDYIVVGGKPEF